MSRSVSINKFVVVIIKINFINSILVVVKNIPTPIQSPPDSGVQKYAGSRTALLILVPSRDAVAFLSLSTSELTSVNVGAPAKERYGNGLSICSLNINPEVQLLHVVQSLTLNCEEYILPSFLYAQPRVYSHG